VREYVRQTGAHCDGRQLVRWIWASQKFERERERGHQKEVRFAFPRERERCCFRSVTDHAMNAGIFVQMDIGLELIARIECLT